MFFSPFTDDKTRQTLASVIANPALDLVIAISFGYLIGVLLRLLRADFLDDLSRTWLGRSKLRLQWPTVPNNYDQEFPYILWIGVVCDKYLPTGARDFYLKNWRNLGKDVEAEIRAHGQRETDA